MSDKTWYVAVGGQQQGPMSVAEIQEGVRDGRYDANTYVFTQGMANWEPLSSRPELSQPASGSAPPPPSVSYAAGGAGGGAAGRTSHEIDYEIHGQEMQFVEITLDPGEACIAEAGRSCTWIRASRWKPSSATVPGRGAAA